MKFARTPDDRFTNLPDWPYAPVYTDVAPLTVVALLRKMQSAVSLIIAQVSTCVRCCATAQLA